LSRYEKLKVAVLHRAKARGKVEDRIHALILDDFWMNCRLGAGSRLGEQPVSLESAIKGS
jgi:hypothetical protein